MTRYQSDSIVIYESEVNMLVQIGSRIRMEQRDKLKQIVRPGKSQNFHVREALDLYFEHLKKKVN